MTERMTAKRFTETVSTGIVTDNVTGKEYKCEMRIDDDLLKLLNEFAEENQQLKHDLEIYEENNTNEVLNQLRIELTSRVNDCIEEFKE